MENESVEEAKWLMCVYVRACPQSHTCHTCPQPLNRHNLHNPFEFSLFLLDGFCNWIFFFHTEEERNTIKLLYLLKYLKLGVVSKFSVLIVVLTFCEKGTILI